MEGFQILPPSGNAELPVPPDAKDGYMEIVRLWYKQDGGELAVQLRGAFQNPTRWAFPLSTMAQAVASLYLSGTDKAEDARETARTAGHLLVAAIAVIANEQESFKDSLLAEFKQATHRAVFGDAPAEADIAEAQDSLPIPEEVVMSEGSRQIVNVWRIPPIDDCECGEEEHEPQRYISAGTIGLQDAEIGKMLAEIAALHCVHVGNNVADQFRASMNVQEAFINNMATGMPRM